MNPETVICFSETPSTFIASDVFLYKIKKAKELQEKNDGEIIWFCNDSETNMPASDYEFEVENEIQKLYSPLYAKRITKNWQQEMAEKLKNNFDTNFISTFQSVKSDTVAGFCIRMYQKLNLLEGVNIIRLSDPAVRRSAIPVNGFYIDTSWNNQTVRGLFKDNHLELNTKHTHLPLPVFNQETLSPTQENYFDWLFSVINPTYYILDENEKKIINKEKFPRITFIELDYLAK